MVIQVLELHLHQQSSTSDLQSDKVTPEESIKRGEEERGKKKIKQKWLS